MHNKILITDNDIATGSYNFSANAKRNAENQLHVHNSELADRYATHIDTITAAYQHP
jgi:phosphatidylserine/phosphatidylglycerophosphate/cardiolipin synthase-like enzyme